HYALRITHHASRPSHHRNRPAAAEDDGAGGHQLEQMWLNARWGAAIEGEGGEQERSCQPGGNQTSSWLATKERGGDADAGCRPERGGPEGNWRPAFAEHDGKSAFALNAIAGDIWQDSREVDRNDEDAANRVEPEQSWLEPLHHQP